MVGRGGVIWVDWSGYFGHVNLEDKMKAKYPRSWGDNFWDFGGTLWLHLHKEISDFFIFFMGCSFCYSHKCSKSPDRRT